MGPSVYVRGDRRAIGAAELQGGQFDDFADRCDHDIRLIVERTKPARASVVRV
jgi:hypothetical protein